MNDSVHPQKHRYKIYTDGGCIGNPGAGGYGVVILCGMERKELSGGYRLTTNNRMELLAAVVALGETKKNSQIELFSDSSYLVNSMNKGWAKGWRSNGWRKADKKKASNIDLWKILLNLCEERTVKFTWVQGHAGLRENERCDALCMQAAKKKNLPPDLGYEEENIHQDSLFNK